MKQNSFHKVLRTGGVIAICLAAGIGFHLVSYEFCQLSLKYGAAIIYDCDAAGATYVGLSILAGALGFLIRTTPWLWGIVIMFGQAVAMVIHAYSLFTPSSTLALIWPRGWPLAPSVTLSALLVVVSYGGRILRRMRTSTLMDLVALVAFGVGAASAVQISVIWPDSGPGLLLIAGWIALPYVIMGRTAARSTTMISSGLVILVLGASTALSFLVFVHLNPYDAQAGIDLLFPSLFQTVVSALVAAVVSVANRRSRRQPPQKSSQSSV